MTILLEQTISRLQQLVQTPSLSRNEGTAADLFVQWMQEDGFSPRRHLNNVYILPEQIHSGKPVVLMNSHLDTVKPNAGYTRDPHDGVIADGKLYGLGSNDAGGPLMCLYTAFKELIQISDLPFVPVFAATAEEEVSGENGIVSLMPLLGSIDLAIIGEPTSMRMATAEKGLMVIDATIHTKGGHAAHDDFENALYLALDDIQFIRNYKFSKISPELGPVKMTTTIIQSGTQHNVVPSSCTFTIDIRMNECYTHQELLDELQSFIKSKLTPRSFRLKPSFLPENHPARKWAKDHHIETYGSPTLSDQALLSCPSFKMGPGDTLRSHIANEYITLEELKQGIETYIKLRDLNFNS